MKKFLGKVYLSGCMVPILTRPILADSPHKALAGLEDYAHELYGEEFWYDVQVIELNEDQLEIND